uniref:Uncharacterized protein n=1 Tax=Magallana gigas TaxID=29159 RepID=A0A8W8I6W2_MAGGI
MGQVRLTIVLFLGTFVHALVIEDPQNEQSLPAGFQRPTLKSSLDEPLGFGQISPFSGVPSPGAGNFPSGQGPLSGFPVGTGSASGRQGVRGVPGGSGSFLSGTGSVNGIVPRSVLLLLTYQEAQASFLLHWEDHRIDHSPSHKIGDLVPIGHGVPRIPPPPLNGPECQFSGCSIGRECVIAKTIVTESATLCPRAYSGRCVCVPGCVHHQKFIPQGYLKYEGRCSYCKCFPDGRVECKKSKACFAAKRRDREIHRQDREIHRHMDRPVRRNGRRRVGVFDLGGIVRSFLGRILG